MTPRSGRVLLTTLILVAASPWSRASEPARTIPFRVQAGLLDRHDSLIQFPVPADRLGPEIAQALDHGPVALNVIDPTANPAAQPGVAQLARRADGSLGVTWFLTRPIKAGDEARFALDLQPADPVARSPWSLTERPAGAWELQHGDRTVFRYNGAPVAPPRPGMSSNLVRDAYIHPAFSPSGALITGDFSPNHPHHRGFFLAYVHTKWGQLAPDFWNIQNGSGLIVAEGVEPPRVGPVSIRFATRHRWEVKGKGDTAASPRPVALRESWEVEAFDVPGAPFWLFDLTSTQRAETHPLELLPYRYGGMAYRSAEPSLIGVLDVLTAEGRHRVDGDQKPTRWVDLTGPVALGSPNYAGAMIADHPSNPGSPSVVRIHPVLLPFFSYVPAHDRPLTIGTDEPTRFRYRILIHDGRPDSALNNRIAQDFTNPPAVILD